MKKFKSLRAIVVGASLLLGAGPLRPAFAWFSATYFESGIVNTSSVTVAASTTVPTVLPAAGGAAATIQLWCIQANNAGESVMIQSSTSGFNTSKTAGTARIPCTPATVAPWVFTLDDYTGPVYAVNTTTYTLPVNYLRKR